MEKLLYLHLGSPDHHKKETGKPPHGTGVTQEFEIAIPTVMLRPMSTAVALILLPRRTIGLPRSGRADGVVSLGRRSDSDSGSIMVIIFSAIVLVALAYALVIGWEKTKPKPEAQSEQSRPLSAEESGPEMPRVGEREQSPSITRERSLQAE
jgi:hypothetical protein